MTRSIRARMTVACSAVLAVLLAVSCVGLSYQARRAAEGHVSGLLATAAGKLSQYGRREPQVDIGELIEDAPDIPVEGMTLAIRGSDGQELWRSRTNAPDQPHTSRAGWRVSTVAVGPHTVVIGYPWEATERTLRRQELVLAVLSCIVLAVGTAGAWILVGRTLRPIAWLAQQARAAGGDRAQPQLVPSSGDSEIVELVDTLNCLLARQAEAAEARGRFYAAASHELRTPLQALSGHLELALMRPRSAEAYRAAIEEACDQSARLMGLVRALLLLNQVESAPPPGSEPIELAELCAATIERIGPVGEHRGIRWACNVPRDIVAMAPPTHAEMLLRNLVENAARYGSASSEVTIDGQRTAEGALVEICNECDAATDWDVDALFEPFRRPDAARGEATGGNGLGLSICRAIARANGWTLDLQSAGGRVRACITFPTLGQEDGPSQSFADALGPG